MENAEANGSQDVSRDAAEANGNPSQSSSPRKSPPPPDHEEKVTHEEKAAHEDKAAHEEKATHLRFLLSNAEAGSVIGKAGATISDFQSRSEARIQLSRNFEFFPGTYDRIAMVAGTVNCVLKGVELILTKVLDEFYAEDGGDVDPRFKTRLIVPNGSCGGIIGKGGCIIKSLTEESQAGIKISPLDNTYPGVYDRLVTINGKIGEQMRAIEMILLKLTDDPLYTKSVAGPYVYAGLVAPYNGVYYPNGVGRKFQNGRIQNKEERSNPMTMGVPDEHIGLVVGRGGRNIADISQVSGARIKISERGDFISGTSDRKVTITGSQRSIRIAESLISQKLSSVNNDR